MKVTAIKVYIQSNIQYIQCRCYTVSHNHPLDKKKFASSQNLNQDVEKYILPTWRDSLQKKELKALL